MAKLDFATVVVDKYKTEEVIGACVTMLKGINGGLMAGIKDQNLGVVGQQQGNLLLVQNTLDKLNNKLSGQKPIDVI